MAHQFLGQLPPMLREAVLGNAGSILTFRVGAADAGVLAPELGLHSPSTLVELPNFQAWTRLMQWGVPSDSFLLATELPNTADSGRTTAVVARTRGRYTRSRQQVEAEVGSFISNPMPLS